MSQSLTIPATESNPLYVPLYPMYNGTYCPHLFWHKTVPSNGNIPHREEIWCSVYRPEITGSIYDRWSKPKRISHRNATICLINYDQSKTPPRVSFASIFLPEKVSHELQYAGHPQHTPFVSLSNDQLHKEPTGQDIYHFFSNPNHFFTTKQLQLLSKTMLKFFPSDFPEYQIPHKLWLPSNPSIPTQQTSWPSRTDISLSTYFQAVPQTLIPPTQIIHTSATRQYIVQSYPIAYGKFATAKFWIETKEETKTSNRKEVAYIQFFDDNGKPVGLPKACSPAKATICLMQIQNNPGEPNFGLPYFNTINLNSWNLQEEKEQVLAFAMNPNNYFNDKQIAILLECLMSFYNFVSSDMQQLREAWAVRPVVPPQ